MDTRSTLILIRLISLDTFIIHKSNLTTKTKIHFMRFLKRKIVKAQRGYSTKKNNTVKMFSYVLCRKTKKIGSAKSLTQRNRNLDLPKSKVPHRCLKNVAKNYGRAICNFVISEISDLYLEPLIKNTSIDIKVYRKFIKEKKESMDGIESLRELLLPNEADDKLIADYKKTFQHLAIIFIKYFSVNWIYGGKLSYKMEYLKLRFKMLRRVQNPELFTCIR